MPHFATSYGMLRLTSPCGLYYATSGYRQYGNTSLRNGRAVDYVVRGKSSSKYHPQESMGSVKPTVDKRTLVV